VASAEPAQQWIEADERGMASLGRSQLNPVLGKRQGNQGVKKKRQATRIPRRRPHKSRGHAPFKGIASGPTQHYVIVPRDLPFVNNGIFWSGNELVKRAPRLAITQDLVLHEVNLLFCDSRGRILSATSDISVKAAKQSAEGFYPGLASHWVDLGVSEEDAERYMVRMRRYHGCSFWRRAPAEHGGSQIQVRQTRICAECVTDFYRDLQQRQVHSPIRR
jgi:hypothetical protein